MEMFHLCNENVIWIEIFQGWSIKVVLNKMIFYLSEIKYNYHGEGQFFLLLIGMRGMFINQTIRHNLGIIFI